MSMFNISTLDILVETDRCEMCSLEYRCQKSNICSTSLLAVMTRSILMMIDVRIISFNFGVLLCCTQYTVQ